VLKNQQFENQRCVLFSKHEPRKNPVFGSILP
jgi:hypothetical protein